jgi:hypothetical protein
VASIVAGVPSGSRASAFAPFASAALTSATIACGGRGEQALIGIGCMRDTHVDSLPRRAAMKAIAALHPRRVLGTLPT